jgi:hypothetical protein
MRSCVIAMAVLWASWLVALPVHAGAAGDPASPDTLWQKAVAIAGRNQHWVPGLVVTRTEEVDDQGHPKSMQESWTRLRPGDDGKPASEILKFLKDGKDETEKAKREEAERKAKETKEKPRNPAGGKGAPSDSAGSGGGPRRSVPLRFGGPTPFDPDVQDSVSYRRQDRAHPSADNPGIAYEFSQLTAGGTTIRGTAWLAERTGIPLRVSFTTDPLPKHVKELSASVGFATGADGSWWPTEISFDAMGKFLLFKKRFHSTATFSEHWWQEEGG